MNIMITGAQFINKGAQSLLFNMISQLRNRYSDNATIYYVPIDDYTEYPTDEYKFEVLYGKKLALDYAEGPMQRSIIRFKCFIKTILGKKHIPLCDIKKYHNTLSKIDVLIDISGYQLSSKWDALINERYLKYIQNAKDHGAKVILMPQSFGPFEYGSSQTMMEQLIVKTLKEVDLIYAREKDGANHLKNLGIDNVLLSPDLVLQSGAINPENIFYTTPKFKYRILKTKNNVGIVPNAQTFRHGDSNIVLKIYQEMIHYLISNGKNVYIFRHSEDLDACKKIYESFIYEKNVQLIEDEMNCFEYSEFVKQFEFIVASRYHAVVHAYKECIPVIILGWAVKYQELAALFGQEKFVFDITKMLPSEVQHILDAIDVMIMNYQSAKSVLNNKLSEIQMQSCFDECWSVIDS